MKLYHGSNCEIDEIDLNMSKPNKDFGRGFYLSKEKEQAMKMTEWDSRYAGTLKKRSLSRRFLNV